MSIEGQKTKVETLKENAPWKLTSKLVGSSRGNSIVYSRDVVSAIGALRMSWLHHATNHVLLVGGVIGQRHKSHSGWADIGKVVIGEAAGACRWLPEEVKREPVVVVIFVVFVFVFVFIVVILIVIVVIIVVDVGVVPSSTGWLWHNVGCITLGSLVFLIYIVPRHMRAGL